MQGPPEPESTPRRLTRLEEGLAFTQHDVDALSAQTRDLFDALETLRRRLEAMERRLERIEQPEQDVPPAPGVS